MRLVEVTIHSPFGVRKKIGIHFNTFNMASVVSYNDLDSSFSQHSFYQETTMHEVFYRVDGKWKYETSDFVIKDYDKKITKELEQILKLALIMHPKGNTITIPEITGQVKYFTYVCNGKLKKCVVRGN